MNDTGRFEHEFGDDPGGQDDIPRAAVVAVVAYFGTLTALALGAAAGIAWIVIHASGTAS